MNKVEQLDDEVSIYFAWPLIRDEVLAGIVEEEIDGLIERCEKYAAKNNLALDTSNLRVALLEYARFDSMTREEMDQRQL